MHETLLLLSGVNTALNPLTQLSLFFLSFPRHMLSMSSQCFNVVLTMYTCNIVSHVFFPVKAAAALFAGWRVVQVSFYKVYYRRVISRVLFSCILFSASSSDLNLGRLSHPHLNKLEDLKLHPSAIYMKELTVWRILNSSFEMFKFMFMGSLLVVHHTGNCPVYGIILGHPESELSFRSLKNI